MQFLERGGGGAFAPNAPSWIRHWLPGIIYYACACRPEQGGVTQALAVGRTATAVKV